MEYLFSTHINETPYRVIFDKERYTFLPDADQSGASVFSLVREHDEWVDRDPLPEHIKTQAIEALEKYLLKQH
jgi:hypothetical protein